jgi:hypothetical protein
MKRRSVAETRRSRPTGREAEVVDAVESAFERRPDAAEDPRVRGPGRDVVGKAAPIEMQHAAHAQDVGSIGGLDAEALLRRGAHHRCGRYCGLGGFVLQFELALEHADLLLLCLQALA